MSTTTRHCILFLICLLFAAFLLSPTEQAKVGDSKLIHGSNLQELDSTHGKLFLERISGGRKMEIRRRVGIGSMAPTCTYNECRGCKYKCRAEQIPVDGNDPINSPIHYKCVCHRT